MNKPLNLFFASLVFFLASCASIRPPQKKVEGARILWSKRVIDQYSSGNLSYNRKAAHIDSASKSVYAFSGEHVFTSHGLMSGKLNWQHKHEQRVVATPATSREYVFYGLESGDFLARDLKTGKLAYKVALTSAINSKPVLSEGKIFLSLEEHGIVCLEESSGELLWSYQRPLSKEVTLLKGSHPMVFGDLLITGFDDGAVVALNIFDGGITWQKQIESKARFLDIDTKPLYAHRKLYVGGLKKFVIMDPKSGNVIKRLKTSLSSNPAAYKNDVFFGKSTGHIEFISSTGKFVKRIKIAKTPIVFTGLLSNSQIIAVSQNGQVFVMDASTLKIQKTFKLGHPSSTIADDISVEDGYAAIMSTRYRLYVLESLLK